LLEQVKLIRGWCFSKGDSKKQEAQEMPLKKKRTFQATGVYSHEGFYKHSKNLHVILVQSPANLLCRFSFSICAEASTAMMFCKPLLPVTGAFLRRAPLAGLPRKATSCKS
jgi:hypothetical protein